MSENKFIARGGNAEAQEMASRESQTPARATELMTPNTHLPARELAPRKSEASPGAKPALPPKGPMPRGSDDTARKRRVRRGHAELDAPIMDASPTIGASESEAPPEARLAMTPIHGSPPGLDGAARKRGARRGRGLGDTLKSCAAATNGDASDGEARTGHGGSAPHKDGACPSNDAPRKPRVRRGQERGETQALPAPVTHCADHDWSDPQTGPVGAQSGQRSDETRLFRAALHNSAGPKCSDTQKRSASSEAGQGRCKTQRATARLDNSADRATGARLTTPVGGGDSQGRSAIHRTPAVSDYFTGHCQGATHTPIAGDGRGAPPPDPSFGRVSTDTQIACAEGGGDLAPSDVQAVGVAPGLIAAIGSLHREHRGLQQAVGDMERRIKADQRWAAVSRLRDAGQALPRGKFPTVTKEDVALIAGARGRYFAVRDFIETRRKECERELLQLAKQLPVATWINDVRGFGLPSLAAVVGEAGDLSHYSNPAKLWKRMGLAVIDGRSQRKAKDIAEAKRQGYEPRRAAQMFMIGSNFLRAGGEYADLYRERKAYELEKGITKGHAHKRALRYIEKRLLRDLWRAWRESMTPHVTDEQLAPIPGVTKHAQKRVLERHGFLPSAAAWARAVDDIGQGRAQPVAQAARGGDIFVVRIEGPRGEVPMGVVCTRGERKAILTALPPTDARLEAETDG